MSPLRVAVVGFELFGQVAKLCQFGGFPCVTYVKRDDTYISLCQRISIIVGCDDALRLALIIDRIPIFISTQSISEVEERNELNNDSRKCESSLVWDMFAKHLRSENCLRGVSAMPLLGVQIFSGKMSNRQGIK